LYVCHSTAPLYGKEEEYALSLKHNEGPNMHASPQSQPAS
jgi:hypothetical protein